MYWVNFLHFYQPPNQDPYLLKQIAKKSYLHIIKTLKKNPQAKFTINISGSLTEQLIRLKLNEIINGLKELAKNGQIELVGTAKYHPILPLLPKKEIIRQIKINDNINQTYLGTVYQPKGFFLPEMAYNKTVAKVIKEMGFEWIILDEISFNGKLNQVNYNTQYKIKGLDLKVVFRNRKFSKTFVPATILKLGRQPIKPKFVITATDGEMYGHYHTDYENLFDKSLKEKEVKTITVSQLLRLYQTEKEIEPVAASWESTAEELQTNNPYSFWNDPKNKIQKLMWELSAQAIKSINNHNEAADTDWARKHLDLGLASCSWWWAAGKKADVFGPLAWNPDIIEKGAKELISSIRSLEKTWSKTKIQAENIYHQLTKKIWEKHWGKNKKNKGKTKLNFSEQKINARKKQIFKKYELAPKHILSSTGHYYVSSCVDDKGKVFILKIRLKNNPGAEKIFLREIFFWQALVNLKNYPLARPKEIKFDTKNKPEFLIYSKIEGKSIGNFYYIYHPQNIPLINKKIASTLFFLQNKTSSLKRKVPLLPKNNFQENFKFFKSFSETTQQYLNKKFLTQGEKIIKNNKKFINQQPLKICHGDLNPRNIIMTNKNMAIIDWSDICLNNQMFDLAFFSLTAWQNRDNGKKLLKIYTQKFKQKEKLEKLFYLNQLIIIPKFIQILHDSIRYADSSQKKIINKALKATAENLETITKFQSRI